MCRFFGGVPRLTVPDNLKSAVNKASFYDPEINRSYGMMAAHYGVGVLPARPRKPRDKAKVEAGVRFAQTYILGRLRHQTFFSLAECNAAIKDCLDRINGHVMRRLGVSRRDLFETIERPALRPLPAQDYEYAEWRLVRVGLDYHVEAAGYFYSVPHTFIGAEVDVRVTARTVEVFHRGQRIAAHERRYGPAWHRSRAHAERASPLRRMDAGPLPPLGALDRAEHRSADHSHPGKSAASRAGLSNLSWRAAALSRHRAGPRRGGLGPCARNQRDDLQKRRLDPQQQSGPRCQSSEPGRADAV